MTDGVPSCRADSGGPLGRRVPYSLGPPLRKQEFGSYYIFLAPCGPPFWFLSPPWPSTEYSLGYRDSTRFPALRSLLEVRARALVGAEFACCATVGRATSAMTTGAAEVSLLIAYEFGMGLRPAPDGAGPVVSVRWGWQPFFRNSISFELVKTLVVTDASRTTFRVCGPRGSLRFGVLHILTQPLRFCAALLCTSVYV